MEINKNIAISESGFVFNPLTGDSYSVNQIGKFILTRLKKGVIAEEIVKEISEKFIVDKVTAEKDFNDFVILLNSFQILENIDEA